ncbi:hypothetical protein [Nocardia miyunensis]|uniref:hypothetical protein n=1 Tax=Nocardia miyunensis TaxID=282684 RepID=UPI0012F49D19|nr:hypothetical protein [Nocardia miyunensis]
MQLRRHLADLDTAAQNLDLICPDRDSLTDSSPDLHDLVAVADRTFTRYLIVHRNVLGRMRFWDVDHQLIDRDPRVVGTVTFDAGPTPVDGSGMSTREKPECEPQVHPDEQSQ